MAPQYRVPISLVQAEIDMAPAEAERFVAVLHDWTEPVQVRGDGVCG